MARDQFRLEMAEKRFDFGEELAGDVLRGRRHVTKCGMIFVEKLVIETRVQNFFHPPFDLADVNQHPVRDVDLAGENKIGDVVSPSPITGGRFRPEGTDIFGVRPSRNKEAT